MNYVIVTGGAVTSHITDGSNIQFASNVFQPASTLSAAQMTQFGVFSVTPAAQPASNPLTQTCVETTPTLVAGVWTQTWTVSALPSAQAAQNLYSAAIAAGLAVVSTATPALNGTYSVAPTAAANITAIMAGAAAGLGLPGSGTTFVYMDASGSPHTFTAAQFSTLAVAVRDYVYALDMFAAGVAPQPVAAVTIP